MSTEIKTNIYPVLIHILYLLLINISYAQPTSSPIDSSSNKAADNLYGPDSFTTLDWILSACILTILCGIFICCIFCIREKIKSSTPQSQISVRSTINQSEMTSITHNRSNSNTKSRPKVNKSHSFGSTHIKQNSKAFDAVVVGVALTKKNSNIDIYQQVDTGNGFQNTDETKEPELEPIDDDNNEQYGSYNIDANKYGYSPLTQQENEDIQLEQSIENKEIQNEQNIEVKDIIIPTGPPPPPPPVPPKVPQSILNELNKDKNQEETEYEQEYLSIEEAKALTGGDKEKRLNDEDFMCVFGMGKDDFYKLPKWKQKNLKKSKAFF